MLKQSLPMRTCSSLPRRLAYSRKPPLKSRLEVPWGRRCPAATLLPIAPKRFCSPSGRHRHHRCGFDLIELREALGVAVQENLFSSDCRQPDDRQSSRGHLGPLRMWVQVGGSPRKAQGVEPQCGLYA